MARSLTVVRCASSLAALPLRESNRVRTLDPLGQYKQKRPRMRPFLFVLAERVGFEPTKGY